MHMAESLHSVCMEKYIVLLGDFTNFLKWLDGADFVVGRHYRNKSCLFCDSIFELFEADNAIGVNIEICHFKALLLHSFASAENCRMFDLCCDNVISALILGSNAVEHAADNHIIRFCARACEENFCWICVNKLRDWFTRSIYSLF